MIRKLLQPVLAVALGLALGLGVTWMAGENPWHVFMILGQGAFGSGYDLGMTLFYATPLIFTGLSVAVAFPPCFITSVTVISPRGPPP